MRNFVFLGSPDHLRKRMLKDAEEFVRHFRFRPQKRLQPLNPLEVRNDYAAGVAEDVWDHENFVPAIFQNQICLGRGRAISGFGKDAAFELTGISASDYAIDRCRDKYVTREDE